MKFGEFLRCCQRYARQLHLGKAQTTTSHVPSFFDFLSSSHHHHYPRRRLPSLISFFRRTQPSEVTMEVDDKKYWHQLLPILKSISTATFVAVDVEMSGISIRRHGVNDRSRKTGKPNLQEQYEETKLAAETYQVLQFGITCVEEDRERGMPCLVTCLSWIFSLSSTDDNRHVCSSAIQLQCYSPFHPWRQT